MMNIAKHIMFTCLGMPAVALALQIPLMAQTCDTCTQPAPACQPPPPAECIVWAPQIVFENRTITVARYRHETRERMVLVSRDVPVIKNIEEEYTVMTPQTRTRTVEDTINHPQYHDIVLRKTDMAPQIEARQATRTVCKLVSFQEEKTVYDLVNQCDQNTSAAPPPNTQTAAPPADPASPAGCATCGQPAPCTTCRQITVPRTVSTTCTKPVNEQETVQYPVTRMQPSSQMQNVSYYEFKPEYVTHEEQYTVQVPEKRVRTRQVTETRTITQEKPEKYTVLIPYHEKVQVPCPVLRCVPMRVAVPAPSCDTCGS
jgi:hypothetical protein